MPSRHSGIACYACGGTYGRQIMAAFAKGCGGELIDPPNPKYRPGVQVVWGLLRGAPQIIEQAQERGDPWFYLDHGYFRRGFPDGHFRVTYLGHQKTVIEDRPPDRWKALNLPPAKMPRGPDVVVAPPSANVQAIFCPDWPPDLKTDRKLLFSKKDGKPWFEKFSSAHMLVTYNSIAAVEAVMRGVPVMTFGENAAQVFSSPAVEQPFTPDKAERERWAHSLAYGQFTLREMQDGIAWQTLRAYL